MQNGRMNFFNYQACRRGFTLVELLTAAIIVAILVMIATPLYEKTVERSHVAEARTILTSLQEAKLFAMDKMDVEQYGQDEEGNTLNDKDIKPQMGHLNIAFTTINAQGAVQDATGLSFSTRYFTYSLKPTGSGVNPNGVCAKRIGGEATNTVFYYYHPMGSSTSEFLCKDPGSSYKYCERVFGMDSTSSTVNCN